MAKNIKVIPRWWKFIPFLGIDVATTIYPNIYLPDSVYKNLLSSNPGILEESILLHENIHLERQAKTNVVIWNLKYLFIPSFRLSEELVAIEVQMKYLKKYGKKYDCARKAQHFSSSIYFWMLSYQKSLILLKNLWERV